MVIGLKYLRKLAATGLPLLLCSCEPFYDPVARGDVPTSQGSVWNKQPIVVRETFVNPFTLADLTQDMSLAQLLDIGLYNNPATRASWNAARASAYAYRASLSTYYPAITYNGSLEVEKTRGSSIANIAATAANTAATASIQNAATSTISTAATTATAAAFKQPSYTTQAATNPNTTTQNSSTAAAASTTAAAATSSHLTSLSNNLSLTYLLLDFGGRSATTELALQTLYAANWEHDLTVQQVMLSVLNAYTSYLGNKGLVKAYEQDLSDAQVALNAATVMRSAGLATLTDVLSAQATLEQTRTSLLQAEGAEKTALGELLIAVGLPADSPVTIENLPQKLPVVDIAGDISSLLELAKKRRPDLGIAIATIKQQEASLAIAYSNSMPALTANASWNQVRFISPRYPSEYNEAAFLELNAPLFQGFFYLNQQRQLQAQVQEALANLDVQVATVSTQVVTAYYSLIAAEAALPSSEAAVQYSQRAFRGFVAQYKTGTASILDVLTALTNLSNARAQEVVIRTQWAASLASLAFAVGVLTDTGGNWQQAPPKQLYQVSIRDDDKSKTARSKDAPKTSCADATSKTTRDDDVLKNR